MIEVHNVSKAFGDFQVLNEVSLSIPEGATTCIVGKSGSGKSVLTKIILGLLEKDEGEVIIDGESTRGFRQKDWHRVLDNFGVVFQGAALFDSLTILENVAIKLYEERKFSHAVIRKKAIEALKAVDLDASILDKFPSQISGGMRKRVGISRAIVHEPKYIIYDEPSTGLDPVSSGVIDELINSLAESSGRTSIIITHDMYTVKDVSSHVAMIYDTRLLYDGDVDGFLGSELPQIQAFLRRSI